MPKLKNGRYIRVETRRWFGLKGEKRACTQQEVN